MSYTSTEIASQPQCWERAAELADSVSDRFPLRGERVAVVGCGTSWFMAQSFASLRESEGWGETDAFPASDFPATRHYDRIIAITRSGATTEVLRLLRDVGPDTRRVVITADGASPATSLADAAVVLSFADERSIVQTRFATTALALWRSHHGHDLHEAAAAARDLVESPVPDAWLGQARFTFLGTGWCVGLAHEAALKVREASQSWSESYSGMEFRHGPVSVADRESLVWIIGDAPSGLREELRRIGCMTVSHDVDPMAGLVGAQRLAVALSEAKGLDPDSPRNLGRSVILRGA